MVEELLLRETPRIPCCLVSATFDPTPVYLLLTYLYQVRGQGLQHAIQDASNYVDAMVQIGESSDIAAAQGAMAAYDADMVARGSKAVLQSIQEAAFAFDEKTVSKMTMARQGHGNV